MGVSGGPSLRGVRMFFPTALIFFFLIGYSSASGAHWDYNLRGDSGPAHWSRLFSQCAGNRQSPIDLKPTQEESLLPLQLIYYSSIPSEAHLTNNGHTAKLSNHHHQSGDIPAMIGGGLPTKYEFAQVHFHWGSEDGQGSEHLVDGKAYPMEMHLVHYKASLGNLNAAVTEGAPDSLAVLGFFFEVGDSPNPGLAELVSRFPEVREAEAKILDAPKIRLNSLLHGSDLSSFYRYEGSLTTPSCNQIVQWTVVKQPLMISKEQLEAFRQLEDGHSHKIVDNFRPVQSTIGRKVSLVDTSPRGSGAGSVSAPLFTSLMMMVVLFLNVDSAI